MRQPVIITCAVTGSIHIPSLSPYLPITPQQIASEAVDAAAAGAASLHLHARDPKDGSPTMSTDLFRTICREVSNASDAVICMTTGGSPTMTPEERTIAVAELKPELASINMGSFNFGLFPMTSRVKEYKFDWEKPYLESSKDLVFKNTFRDMERILGIMEENGTKPEMECYDVGHLYNVAHWVEKGMLTPPFWLQLIFGITGAIQPSVENLVFMKNTADRLFGENYLFSVLAVGRYQFSMCTTGAIMGGNVRVGLEDNLYLAKGMLAKSNSEQVTKMLNILETLDMEVANPSQMRKALGLKGKEQTNY